MSNDCTHKRNVPPFQRKSFGAIVALGHKISTESAHVICVDVAVAAVAPVIVVQRLDASSRMMIASATRLPIATTTTTTVSCVRFGSLVRSFTSRHNRLENHGRRCGAIAHSCVRATHPQPRRINNFQLNA